MAIFLRASWLLILSSLFNCLFAQQLTSPSVLTPKQPKWEVGMDLLWLINKNVLPNYALLVRRNIGSRGAIRLRGGYESYSTGTTQYDGHDTKAYQIRAGYEYRTVLKANKSILFYGADLIYGYDHEFFYDYSHPAMTVPVLPNAPTAISNLYFTTATERGASIFIGYKYFLQTNLSLSAESTFQITYWKQDVFQIGVGYYPQRFTNIRVFPLTSLTLSYHF